MQGPLKGGGYTVGTIKAIACLHQPLHAAGLSADVFERFGEYLVDMLASDEFVSTCPDGKRAWMLFFAYLVDSVRAEYEKLVFKKLKSHG